MVPKMYRGQMCNLVNSHELLVLGHGEVAGSKETERPAAGNSMIGYIGEGCKLSKHLLDERAGLIDLCSKSLCLRKHMLCSIAPRLVFVALFVSLGKRCLLSSCLYQRKQRATICRNSFVAADFTGAMIMITLLQGEGQNMCLLCVYCT